ncbi:MAG TPA: nuclear transport factor 2 family protein [Candidatus Acidoferrum sp.]|nr:nuclear transport factor 2 family protein [Candidatus Acidoferrum sp.]
MQKYIAGTCGALLLTCFVFGQNPKATSSQPAKSTADAELTNLFDAKIKAEWQAIKSKDQKAYGDLLAEDFVAVEADGGGERYKWKALNELQQSAVADYTLSFLKVTSLCSEAAFVRYEVFIKFPPKSVVPFEKILVGETWVKREGQWKVLHYQETRVK